MADKESHLWHRRFCHLNYQGLKTLAANNMVDGMPLLKVPKKLCEACLIGKQHKESAQKQSSWRASKQLQLVHSDLCGPIKPSSNSNKRYIISFTDDFSRKTWVYFLHEKSEAFSAFKNFKISVEKEIGMHIACLRINRGGEFNSNDFRKYCKEHGIRRQLTTAYTPHQNGVAGRKNRTIMNAVQSMLAEKKLPKCFWPEAVKWCVQNRSPTAAVENKTPEEAWSGKKPVVNYFRIFGSIAHVHIPDQKRIKLYDKSIKCVFLIINDESKAWRLYDPVSRKIIIIKDVVFEEEESWDWGRTDEEIKRDALKWDDEVEYDKGAVEDEPSSSSSSLAQSPSSISSSLTESPPNELNSTKQGELVEGRGARQRRTPGWMDDYVTEGRFFDGEDLNAMMVTLNDPISFAEAVKNKKWREAMSAEIEAIERNQTWELTELPNGVKPIGVKWVFKTKLNENGDVEKFKARLVAKGYAQRHGMDYTEVFAHVARFDTIRMMLAVAAQFNWEVFQLDVKSAFLHEELKEEVYVQQPEGYTKKGEEEKVYKLQKALYGLK